MIKILGSNICLTGYGKSTKLKAGDGGQFGEGGVGAIIAIGDGNTPLENIMIENITIDGNNQGEGEEGCIVVWGWYDITIKDVLIRNCKVQNFRHGTVVAFSENVQIELLESRNNHYHGIEISHSKHINLISCRAIQNGMHGILLWNSEKCNVVCCRCCNNAANGIFVQSSQKCIITANRCNGNGAGVFVDNNSNDNIIIGNDLENNTNTLVNFGLNTVAKDNIAFNPQAPAPITVEDSPFTYQNTDPYPVDIIISGGDTTKIEWSRDGSTWYDLGIIAGKIHLEPGEYIRITYSTTAPSMIKVPL